MKKIFIFMIMSLLLVGLVSAAYNDKDTIKQKVDSIAKKTINRTLASEINSEFNQKQLREGILAGGKAMLFGEGEKMQFRTGNFSIECGKNCNLSEEGGRIQAKLSNGRNAEIKVLPETASQRAREKLNINFCQDSNCSIELKEVGNGNQTRMAYEMEEKTEARFLGLFKTKTNVKVQVDAETGEVISTKKPWWAFLKKENLEETTEDLE